MHDETANIEMELPSDAVSQVSTISEQAKASLGAGGTVTISLPAGMGPKFTELRKDFEAYEKSQVEEWHSVADTVIKLGQLRIAFYEKLILLAGGCFALSLTFLGLLQRHGSGNTPLVALGRLKWAWSLLLVSVVFSWLHNLYRCSEVDHVVASSVVSVKGLQFKAAGRLVARAAGLFRQGTESPVVGLGAAMAQVGKVFEDLSKKSTEDATEFEGRLKRLGRVSGVLGSLALLSIVAAFIFLVGFALKNAGSF
jgi:hypothetical protein